jgi:hypothetical protein
VSDARPPDELWRSRADTRHNRIKVLAAACAEAAGVDGCGISMRDSDGNPVTLETTDDVAAAIEDLQLTLGEGPCMDVAASGSPVLVADLRDRSGGLQGRWPVFVTEADGVGVRALFAFPVRIGAIALGVVDLYRRTAGAMSDTQLASTLSTVDTIGRHMLSDPDGEQDELSYTLTVHQAAGMVMVQLSSGIEEALVRLRATAYADGRPLSGVAADVVSGRLRFRKEHR